METKTYRISTTLLAAFLLLLSSCAVMRSAVCSLKSTDHFKPLKTDPRVFYEPGAEAFAAQVAELLPQALERVEAGQYRPFAKPVAIYVCASDESYTEATGLEAPASATWKGVFLSPRLVREQRPLSLYLAHELSHLHIVQQIGIYKWTKLPAWFHEGLATFVSGGGGAYTVTDSQAIEAIKAGQHFEPHEEGGILFRKYAGNWGLSPHMFYRQSMVFVAYLKALDEQKHRKLVLSIEDGLSFSESFHNAYGLSVAQVWEMFLREL